MNSEGAGEKNFGKRVFCADGVLHCCGQCLLTAVWALTVWACPIACGTKAHLVINFKFQHVLVFISLGMDHAQGLFIRWDHAGNWISTCFCHFCTLQPHFWSVTRHDLFYQEQSFDRNISFVQNAFCHWSNSNSRFPANERCVLLNGGGGFFLACYDFWRKIPGRADKWLYLIFYTVADETHQLCETLIFWGAG